MRFSSRVLGLAFTLLAAAIAVLVGASVASAGPVTEPADRPIEESGWFTFSKSELQCDAATGLSAMDFSVTSTGGQLFIETGGVDLFLVRRYNSDKSHELASPPIPDGDTFSSTMQIADGVYDLYVSHLTFAGVAPYYKGTITAYCSFDPSLVPLDFNTSVVLDGTEMSISWERNGRKAQPHFDRFDLEVSHDGTVFKDVDDYQEACDGTICFVESIRVFVDDRFGELCSTLRFRHDRGDLGAPEQICINRGPRLPAPVIAAVQPTVPYGTPIQFTWEDVDPRSGYAIYIDTQFPRYISTNSFGITRSPGPHCARVRVRPLDDQVHTSSLLSNEACVTVLDRIVVSTDSAFNWNASAVCAADNTIGMRAEVENNTGDAADYRISIVNPDTLTQIHGSHWQPIADGQTGTIEIGGVPAGTWQLRLFERQTDGVERLVAGETPTRTFDTSACDIVVSTDSAFNWNASAVCAADNTIGMRAEVENNTGDAADYRISIVNPDTLTQIHGSHWQPIADGQTGTIEIGGVPAGTWQLRLFERQTDGVERLVAGETPTRTFDTSACDSGSIAGVVTSSRQRAPISGAIVCAQLNGEGDDQCTQTDDVGAYTISEVRSGDIRVSFTDPTGAHRTECYRNLEGCGSWTAVTVTNGQARTGIDATLRARPTCAGRYATVQLSLNEIPTDGDDVIYGTNGPDRIDAGGGDDLICSRQGNDTVYGGDGNDRILTAQGDDFAFGGPGDDTIWGSSGVDHLIGGEDNDIIRGGSGADRVEGNSGADNLRGDADNDHLLGGDNDDTVRGGTGNDLIEGEPGDDRLYGDAGTDVLFGAEGIDRLYGNDGQDELHGGPDNDYLYGGNDADELDGDTGQDRLRGNNGDDTLRGGEDNDFLYGDNGEDTLFGNSGNDLLRGGTEADVLYGGTGDDRLFGEDGGDFLDGGAESDRADGGDGNDLCRNAEREVSCEAGDPPADGFRGNFGVFSAGPNQLRISGWVGLNSEPVIVKVTASNGAELVTESGPRRLANGQPELEVTLGNLPAGSTEICVDAISVIGAIERIDCQTETVTAGNGAGIALLDAPIGRKILAKVWGQFSNNGSIVYRFTIDGALTTEFARIQVPTIENETAFILPDIEPGSYTVCVEATSGDATEPAGCREVVVGGLSTYELDLQAQEVEYTLTRLSTEERFFDEAWDVSYYESGEFDPLNADHIYALEYMFQAIERVDAAVELNTDPDDVLLDFFYRKVNEGFACIMGEAACPEPPGTPIILKVGKVAIGFIPGYDCAEFLYAGPGYLNSAGCALDLTPAGVLDDIVGAGARLRRFDEIPVSSIDELAAATTRNVDEVKAFADCASFAPDTSIMLADGSVKAIGDLTAGELVRSVDPQTGEEAVASVLGTSTKIEPVRIVDLQIETGGTLRTTDGHLFWHADNYWARADELRAGDVIAGADDEHIEVIGASYRWLGDDDSVVSLDVDAYDTYLVVVDGQTLLVHNAGYCPVRKAATNSTNLRSSLDELNPVAADTIFANPGWDAHHIVPHNSLKAKAVREVLELAGIELDSALNGIYLPRNARRANELATEYGVYTGRTLHNQTFRNSYYEYLSETLLDPDIAGSPTAIREALAMIKQDLLAGRPFPKADGTF